MIQKIGRFFKNNSLLISILIGAAILRLYRIDEYMTFLGDEGRDALVVYNILHGKLTLLGPTASVGGFFMGPAYYYLSAPFLWLFQYNPIGPSVMVVFLTFLTMMLMYKMASDFFNKAAGLVAIFFYAISPVVIVYSRASWNPNVMPFFTITTLYLLYEGVKRNKWWIFFLTGLLFGIDIQLHYIELFVGAVIVFYVCLVRLTQKSKSFFKNITQIFRDGISIFIGFLVGFSPFIAFEFRHGFQNLININTFIFQSKDVGGTGNFWGNISDVYFRLFGRVIVNFPTVSEQIYYDKLLLGIWTIFVLFIMTGSTGLLIYTFYKTKEKREKFLQYTLLLSWLGLGVVLFGLYKKSIYDYYLQFLFPIVFILVGYFISFLWTRSVWGKIGAGMSFMIITGICLSVLPFRYEPNNQLNRTKEIASFVLQKTDNKPFNFAYISTGNSDHGYRYFFKLADRDPRVIENSQNDPQRNTVTEQLLVICDALCDPIGHPLWEVAGFGEAKIVNQWDVSIVTVYKLQHTTQK